MKTLVLHTFSSDAYALSIEDHPYLSDQDIPPGKTYLYPGSVWAVCHHFSEHASSENLPHRFFMKSRSAIIGHKEPICIPSGMDTIEVEAELVAILGKRASRITLEQAPQHILGYTCGNDVTMPPWMSSDVTWNRAKASDTFAPIGPVIKKNLRLENSMLSLHINGHTIEECGFSIMKSNPWEVIAALSQYTTLEPGDVVFLGTPLRPALVKAGDVVEVEIKDIGVLANPILESKGHCR